jgi:hypothetical protein
MGSCCRPLKQPTCKEMDYPASPTKNKIMHRCKKGGARRRPSPFVHANWNLFMFTLPKASGRGWAESDALFLVCQDRPLDPYTQTRKHTRTRNREELMFASGPDRAALAPLKRVVLQFFAPSAATASAWPLQDVGVTWTGLIELCLAYLDSCRAIMPRPKTHFKSNTVASNRAKSTSVSGQRERE